MAQEIAQKQKVELLLLDLEVYMLNVILINSIYNLFIAAATALLDVPNMDAEQIAKKAMNIAADLCVYTNHTHMIEVLESVVKDKIK